MKEISIKIIRQEGVADAFATCVMLYIFDNSYIRNTILLYGLIKIYKSIKLLRKLEVINK